jgi:hypothetical protein
MDLKFLLIAYPSCPGGDEPERPQWVKDLDDLQRHMEEYVLPCLRVRMRCRQIRVPKLNKISNELIMDTINRQLEIE